MQGSGIVPEELKPVTIYLSLGSNMGDRWHNLERALHLLARKMAIVMVSSTYDTAPVGNTRQPRFLNLACEATTSLTPKELLTFIKEIEAAMGRQPGPRNSPRHIDIDILFYGGNVINNADLILPHPRLTERAFVLVPLAEIAPDFLHPVIGKKIRQILANLKFNADEVVKWENIRGETCTK
jgi:2-amino-4-hydroxy-6-hydroxymethyldihydropteridine diphosphokinase